MTAIRHTHRLIMVTGKGGVGKTLLATALADRCAAAGFRTVLVTMDPRADRHPLLDVPVAVTTSETPRGFALCRLDGFQALTEYARRKLPFPMLYEGLFRTRGFRDFVGTAPGFEELMCLGKLYDLATASEFDRVIFDAPATGHFRALLDVPDATLRAVQVGPVNHSARRIRDLLLDPERAHVLVVALAEELPLREAQELVTLCRDERRMSVGPVLVNRRVPERFAASELAALNVCADRGELSPGALAALEAACIEAQCAAAQSAALETLRVAGIGWREVSRFIQARFDAGALIAQAGRYLDPLLGVRD